jgi:outer membrane protein assembly factor BamB
MLAPVRPVLALALVLLGLALLPAAAEARRGASVASSPAAGRVKSSLKRSGVCDTLLPLRLKFRFGTGAEPAAAPTLGPRGELYVGTIDGIVHALRPDGSYHWSYTLKGAVTGRLLVDSTGRVLVPTARVIYALHPDGRLAWAFRNPVELLGDLVRDGRGKIRFASRDGRLFEFDERGALVRNVRAEYPWSALPIALPDGSVAGGGAGGLVILSTPRGVSRFELGGRVEQVLACPGKGLCAIAGGELRRLGQAGAPIPAKRAGSEGQWLAVLKDDRNLSLLRGSSGERVFAAYLPEAASAAPAVDERGTVYVPLASGALVAYAVTGRVRGCEQIGRDSLSTPVVAADGSVLVRDREGTIAVLSPEP